MRASTGVAHVYLWSNPVQKGHHHQGIHPLVALSLRSEELGGTLPGKATKQSGKLTLQLIFGKYGFPRLPKKQGQYLDSLVKKISAFRYTRKHFTQASIQSPKGINGFYHQALQSFEINIS